MLGAACELLPWNTQLVECGGVTAAAIAAFHAPSAAPRLHRMLVDRCAPAPRAAVVALAAARPDWRISWKACAAAGSPDAAAGSPDDAVRFEHPPPRTRARRGGGNAEVGGWGVGEGSVGTREDDNCSSDGGGGGADDDGDDGGDADCGDDDGSDDDSDDDDDSSNDDDGGDSDGNDDDAADSDCADESGNGSSADSAGESVGDTARAEGVRRGAGFYEIRIPHRPPHFTPASEAEAASAYFDECGEEQLRAWLSEARKSTAGERAALVARLRKACTLKYFFAPSVLHRRSRRGAAAARELRGNISLRKQAA